MDRNADGASPPSPSELDAFVHGVVDHWRSAPLSRSMRALLEHIEKLTGTPWSCTLQDVAKLRDEGWSDAAIHDAVQVASYFNYINRVADALGVSPEVDLPRWGRMQPPTDR